MLHDRRNLPAPVADRLAEAGMLDDYGVRARGSLVEAGWQYRSRPAGIRLEVRDVTADNGITLPTTQPVLDGYAALWGVTYQVAGGKESMWGWDETIVEGAVDKSLSERDDVYWLFDHAGLPVASTKSGSLQLSSDRVGLLTIATPDMASAYNGEVVMRVRSGDIDAMSWAFRTTRQEWNADYTERWITEAQMFDVSGVKWPANTATALHARKDEDEPRRKVVAPGISLARMQMEAEALRLHHRMDAEDLGILAGMIGMGTEYISEQDEPGDAENIPVMEEALTLIASLVPVEVAEPTEPEDEGSGAGSPMMAD